MVTQAQYDALGPLAREIIDHDRITAAQAGRLAGHPVVVIASGAGIRERRETRARLTAAAATLCNRGTAGSPTGPRTASMGRR